MYIHINVRVHLGLTKNPVVEISVRAAPFCSLTVKREVINKILIFAGLAPGLRTSTVKREGIKQDEEVSNRCRVCDRVAKQARFGLLIHA